MDVEVKELGFQVYSLTDLFCTFLKLVSSVGRRTDCKFVSSFFDGSITNRLLSHIKYVKRIGEKRNGLSSANGYS